MEDIPDIPLEISHYVVSVPSRGGKSSVIQGRIQSLKKECGKLGDRDLGGLKFRDRKGKELEESCPTGQRLPDPREESEMLRPRQDEKTGFFSPIDKSLKIGKKRGEFLCFVDHRAFWKVLEKSSGVGG
jgi:hypothetical protein